MKSNGHIEEIRAPPFGNLRYITRGDCKQTSNVSLIWGSLALAQTAHRTKSQHLFITEDSFITLNSLYMPILLFVLFRTVKIT